MLFLENTKIPGEIFEDKWEGFDKNKTLMMQHVFNKTDYVLHLDADDLLINDLEFTKDDIGGDAYYINVTRGEFKYKAFIIFNNRLTWRFCGVAHTTIKCLERPNISTKDLSGKGFYISGEGIGSRAFDPKKYFYDAEKLKKQFWDTLINDPDELNTRSIFYAAQSYMDCDMIEEGLKWNKLYLKINGGWIEEKFEAQMRVSKCMMSLNYNIENIVEEMEKAISIFPDRAEPLYSLGAYCNKIGEHNLAYKYLTRALPIDINKVKENLDTDEFNDELDQWHEWTFKNLYPYRSIIHHMGELSGTIPKNE